MERHACKRLSGIEGCCYNLCVCNLLGGKIDAGSDDLDFDSVNALQPGQCLRRDVQLAVVRKYWRCCKELVYAGVLIEPEAFHSTGFTSFGRNECLCETVDITTV